MGRKKGRGEWQDILDEVEDGSSPWPAVKAQHRGELVELRRVHADNETNLQHHSSA